MSVELFCPFQMLLTVFESLTDGQKTAIVKFESLETNKIPAGRIGCTIFPERPEMPPLVLIRSDLPVWIALDIMTRELSHVAIGPDKEQEREDFHRELVEGCKQAFLDQNLILDLRLGTVNVSDDLLDHAQKAVESQEALTDEPVDFEALAKSIVDSEIHPLLKGVANTSVDQGEIVALIRKIEKYYKLALNDLKLTQLQLRQILGISDNEFPAWIVTFDLLLKQGRIIQEGKYYMWMA